MGAIFAAVTALNSLTSSPENTAHADTTVEQPVPPTNYAINQFVLK